MAIDRLGGCSCRLWFLVLLPLLPLLVLVALLLLYRVLVFTGRGGREERPAEVRQARAVQKRYKGVNGRTSCPHPPSSYPSPLTLHPSFFLSPGLERVVLIHTALLYWR